ncbi:hypothetical protein F4777DRAFT_560562 [Nemania sp. FL0916]|nr:hypothetical protein F4777DRAFT_560562 [Nemania sp. FL0916]
MAEIRSRLTEPCPVTETLTNITSPDDRQGLLPDSQDSIITRLETIPDDGVLNDTPKPISLLDISRDPQTNLDAACASGQTENDSGYGTSSFNCDTIDPTRERLTFLSRKEIPKKFRDHLVDIRRLLTGPLVEFVFKEGRKTDVAMKLKYADQDNKLYLVVQCDRRATKRMRKFFAQNHAKEIIGNDINVHITAGLRRLVAQDLKVYSAATGKISSGTIIRIRGACGLSVVTLGGIIAVVKDGCEILYGLTAGHALAKLHHNPHLSLPFGNDSSILSNTGDLPNSSEDEQSEVLDGAVLVPSDPISHIGYVTDHSFRSTSLLTNFDWALIKLFPDQNCSNIVHHKCPSEPNTKAKFTALTCTPTVSTVVQSPVKVIIPTSRGNQIGTLTSSESSLLVAPGRQFVEAYDVVLDDGFSLKRGDSGAWVIHETTGEVYGHVVSIDMFGEVYVIPLDHTLSNIRAHLQADRVGLPQDYDKQTSSEKPIKQKENDPKHLENSGSSNDRWKAEDRVWAVGTSSRNPSSDSGYDSGCRSGSNSSNHQSSTNDVRHSTFRAYKSKDHEGRRSEREKVVTYNHNACGYEKYYPTPSYYDHRST